jgi:hypothetical protein
LICTRGSPHRCHKKRSQSCFAHSAEEAGMSSKWLNESNIRTEPSASCRGGQGDSLRHTARSSELVECEKDAAVGAALLAGSAGESVEVPSGCCRWLQQKTCRLSSPIRKNDLNRKRVGKVSLSVTERIITTHCGMARNIWHDIVTLADHTSSPNWCDSLLLALL